MITRLITFLLILLTSCDSGDLAREPEVSYCYTIVNFRQPKVFTEEIETDNGYFVTTEYFYTLRWDSLSYKSEIKEVKNLTEDDKYRLMDKFDIIVRRSFETYLSSYRLEVKFARGMSEEQQQRLLNYKSEVIDRRVESFSTYREASESRYSNH